MAYILQYIYIIGIAIAKGPLVGIGALCGIYKCSIERITTCTWVNGKFCFQCFFNHHGRRLLIGTPVFRGGGVPNLKSCGAIVVEMLEIVWWVLLARRCT